MAKRSIDQGLYVLDGKLAVPVATFEEWCRRYDFRNKHVAETQVGSAWVSTIFLGIDHSWGFGRLPLIFETMVFKDGESGDQVRCGTWEEAEAQHKAMVAKVRAKSHA